MSGQVTRSVADKLVIYARADETEKCLSELYNQNAVAVEATVMPGKTSAETVGIDGIREKHAWWQSSFEVHSGDVEGPFMHGDDKFAVIFEIDCTYKPTGERSQMKEVAIYTVEDGLIVKEEFFWNE